MKDLVKAKEGVIVMRNSLAVTRKNLFEIRKMCDGDYDKIYKLDDVIKDIDRARVNIMQLILDIDFSIANLESKG